MGQCVTCHTEAPAGAVYCIQCGKPLGTTEVATVVIGMGSGSGGGRASTGASRLSVSSAVDEGRFPPGTLLAQRYRISGRLGKGGMGEVYKANDLLVGQPVALKFLPEELAANPHMLERFRNEVRLARQVSHPNVCRVYDLGEAEGHLFLSMEYIDGEDLSSLLRRIGHLPPAKARETAQKLCAGLAAAHEKGVMHRDFKPANIMIDARGQVLITDFGLAAAGVVEAGDIRSGTPAYMAPEQLSGSEVTTRSDLYALGIVLFEIFTGHAPFEAATREELLQKQAGGPPPMTDADTAVERTIARCLEYDPRKRLPNALAVAHALAGGDPLQALVAAGQTPSPEMVAAAGDTEAMSPRRAVLALAAVLVTIAASAVIAGQGWAFSRVAAEIPPDAMAQKSRDMAVRLGYDGKAASSGWAYATDDTILEHLAGLPIPEAWRRISVARPPAVTFWYRQSPTRLVPVNAFSAHISASDPPVNTFGMLSLRLDPQGRLARITAFPVSSEAPDAPAAPYAWNKLFDAAGLNMGSFTAAAPRTTPYVPTGERAAWTGTVDGKPLRVEAAAWHGLPVWFTIADDAPVQDISSAVQARFSRANTAQILFNLFLLLAEVVLAWRNVKLGRGDARGSLRVGALVGLLTFLWHMLSQSHGLDSGEYNRIVQALAVSLFDGGRMAAVYLAFEPFIRRRWPDILISWTRLLAGKLRDPLTGRHFLAGMCGAGVLCLIFTSYILAMGPSSAGARQVDLYSAANTVRVLGQLCNCAGSGIVDGCWACFLVFVFALVLRNRWAAAAAAALLWGAVQAAGAPVPAVTMAVWVSVFAVLYVLLFRYGLLACCAYGLTGEVILDLPVTMDTTAWYFGASALALGTVAMLAFYAYRTAVAGRPLWVAD